MWAQTDNLEDPLGNCGEVLGHSGCLGELCKALSGSWQGSLEALRALWDSGRPPWTLEEFLGILWSSCKNVQGWEGHGISAMTPGNSVRFAISEEIAQELHRGLLFYSL